jgi:hypothetical protein
MRVAARLSFPASGISPNKRARGSAPSLHSERSSESNLCRFVPKLVPRSRAGYGRRSPIRIWLPSYGSAPADAMGFARRMRVCRQSTWPETLSEVISFLVSPFFRKAARGLDSESPPAYSKKGADRSRRPPLPSHPSDYLPLLRSASSAGSFAMFRAIRLASWRVMPLAMSASPYVGWP